MPPSGMCVFNETCGLGVALEHNGDLYACDHLFDFIERNGLLFGRWLRQAPDLPQCGAIASIPHAARLSQLPVEEQYAAVELFRGTMVRHSLIVYRDDRPGERWPLRFDNSGWQSYLPIRLPMTISVQERLPPCAVAVLINQSHTYTDLYLPIDQVEQQLLVAIDGKRTIAEIVHNTGAVLQERDWKRAGTFFERLWNYDQVVFDASRQPDQED